MPGPKLFENPVAGPWTFPADVNPEVALAINALKAVVDEQTATLVRVHSEWRMMNERLKELEKR